MTGAFGGPELPALDRGLRPQIYETLTWMTAIGGSGEQALAWARNCETSGAGLGLPYSDGFAHLALAQAHLISRPEVARTEAQHAIRRFRAAGARFESGRATYVAALAAHALGRTEGDAAPDGQVLSADRGLRRDAAPADHGAPDGTARRR